jgi:hypothetical protein
LTSKHRKKKAGSGKPMSGFTCGSRQETMFRALSTGAFPYTATQNAPRAMATVAQYQKMHERKIGSA